MSLFAGPQKGTYIINPCHMKTEKPVNANDEDLVDGMVGVGRPITEPTSVSYSLQRIRLGEFCREIADSTFVTSETESSDYEQTKRMDAKLCAFAEGLPYFFSLNYDSSQLPEIDPRKSTGIVIQRYIINSLLHTQRCRLHLRYLSRASKDPTYAYSRRACLEAARMVLRTEHQLSTQKITFVLARWKFCGVLHCVCMAIIVLLIDLCANMSPHTDQEQWRQKEILNAFAILENQNPLAQKLLESFRTVLHRHNAPAPDAEGTTSFPGEPKQPLSPGLTGNPTMSTGMMDCTNEISQDLFLDPSLPSFNELWQTFDDNVDPATVDWNSLFGELDPPFLSG